MFRLAALLSAITLVSACSSSPASLVVTDARVWTGAPEEPWAQALAVQDDRIVAVGTNDEIMAWVDDETQVVEAGGRMVTPGFIDSHVHFLTGGFRLSSVQLRDAETPEEFTARIVAFAESVEPGTWITGGDWDHEQWGGELPHRDWIDAVTPDHPVWVNRLDGHMALANTAALEAAGVTAATADVAGGSIERDADGSPTGLFRDNAMSLIWNVVPEPPDALKDRALEAAMAYVAAQGVTSVHNMAGAVGELETLERAHSTGTMQTRVYHAFPLAEWSQLDEKIQAEGTGDEWLRIGGLKGFVDGSLGSHTAAFLEPYTDAPNDRGLFVNEEDSLYRWIADADSVGLHVMVHAIGDRAIRTLLDLYARVDSVNGARDRRFRIEHAQHIHPDDLPRFATLGVIASMQPYHAIDDGRWAEAVIGPARAQTTYAFESLREAGARIVFGSDWFVAPPTPLEGIYAAVTRRTLDGEHPNGWIPEQKMSVEEALRAYTVEAAYASFEENLKGTLEPGKLADFVLIDQDLTTIRPETIRDARIDMTVVGGEIVYETPSAPGASPPW